MILDLSNELLALIVDLLEFQDVLYAQLVCRRLYTVSLPIAASRRFRVITTDLSRNSIEKLQRIFENEVTRHAVRQIHIAAETYGQGWRWHRDHAGFLQHNAEDAVTVRNALAGFPACSSISMERDGMSDLVPSYGISDAYLTTADVMTLIFSSLSTSKQPIQKVTLNLKGKIPKHALAAVTPGSYRSDGFWALWSKLKALSVCVPLDYEGRDAQVAANLASKAANLERLELKDVTSSSAGGPLVDYMIEANHFPNLSHLKLCGISSVPASALATFLGRVEPSLINLRLDRIVVDRDWKEVLSALHQGFQKLRCLTLANLRTQPPDLENTRRVFFCGLRNASAAPAQDELEFIENADTVTKRRFCISGVRCRPENMRLLLASIIDALYLEGQPPADLPAYQPTPARPLIRVFKKVSDDSWIGIDTQFIV